MLGLADDDDETPAVRYLTPYTADNPPPDGDIVWAKHAGTDLIILGHHIVPRPDEEA